MCRAFRSWRRVRAAVGVGRWRGMDTTYLTRAQTRAALRTYTPTRLDASVWSQIRSDAIDVVAAGAPTSPDDAIKLAQALTGFLATRSDLVDLGVRGVLTERNVNVWAYANSARYTPHSLRQIFGRLRRMARAVVGFPPRINQRGSGDTKPVAEPYGAGELDEITGGDPVRWMKDHPKDPRLVRVRVTYDVGLIESVGVVAAAHAGLGRRRLAAAARWMAVPDDERVLLRGAGAASVDGLASNAPGETTGTVGHVSNERSIT